MATPISPPPDEARTYASDARLAAARLRELVSLVQRGDMWTDEQLAVVQDVADQLVNRIVLMPAWQVAS
jgi:polyhydroxyalkanoate synthesis regulator phasin